MPVPSSHSQVCASPSRSAKASRPFHCQPFAFAYFFREANLLRSRRGPRRTKRPASLCFLALLASRLAAQSKTSRGSDYAGGRILPATSLTDVSRRRQPGVAPTGNGSHRPTNNRLDNDSREAHDYGPRGEPRFPKGAPQGSLGGHAELAQQSSRVRPADKKRRLTADKTSVRWRPR